MGSFPLCRSGSTDVKSSRNFGGLLPLLSKQGTTPVLPFDSRIRFAVSLSIVLDCLIFCCRCQSFLESCGLALWCLSLSLRQFSRSSWCPPPQQPQPCSFFGVRDRDRWLFHSFANACNSGQRYASYVLLAIHLLSLSFHVSVCFRFMFQCSVLDSISAVSLWRLVSLGSRMLRLL